MRLWFSAAVIAAAVSLMTSCKMPGEQKAVSNLGEDFVCGSLALSAVSATSAGYHEHNGVRLDEKLDDLGFGSMQEQRKFYSGFYDRLALIKQDALSPEERADYQIIQNQIDLTLLDLSQIQSFRHNPTVYVDLVGNPLFTPSVPEYPPISPPYPPTLHP